MLENIGELIANVQEAGGSVAKEIDELMIRKMVIRRKMLLKEQERLKMLRDAVKAEWDRKISKIDEDIENMEKIILQFVEEHGDKLVLDVATVSSRKVAHKIKIVNEDDFKAQLKAAGLLEQFLGERPVNWTAAKSYYLEQLDRQIEKIQEAANQTIHAKEEQLKFAMKTMKPAEKKEAQAAFAQEKKEILKNAEAEIQKAIEAYQASLPDSLQYEPETRGLSIRMNY
jgi:hypothetical protein